MSDGGNTDPGALPWIDKAGPGAKRTAALLLGLGQELAAEIFKQMTEFEVRQIALGARELKRSGNEAIPEALTKFCEAMGEAGVDALGGDSMLRRLATEIHGPDTVKRTFDAMPPTHQPEELLGVVATADADSFTTMVTRSSTCAARTSLPRSIRREDGEKSDPGDG